MYGEAIDHEGGGEGGEIGSASLTGIRGRVAKAVAKPIAQRTGLTREQVEAIIGFLSLASRIYPVVGPLMRAARRTTSSTRAQS